MKRFALVTLFALSLGVLTYAAAPAAEPGKDAQASPGNHEHGAAAGCMEMMQHAGLSEEGKKAMHDFMQSDRAPQAMAKMMEMARRMGSGDVMLGMTRMMEMMGGSGMMGGHGATTQPGAARPGK